MRATRRKRRCRVERLLARLFIDARAASVSPPPHHSRLGNQLTVRPEPRPRNSVTAAPSLSTLSVGCTNTVSGCPPSAPARQRRRPQPPSVRNQECPALQVSVATPPATSPSRSRSTPTLPNRRPEYLRHTEHAASISHLHDALFDEIASRTSKGPVDALRLSTLTLGTPNTGVDVRCRWCVTTPAAVRTFATSLRRPGEAGPRFRRAKAHPHRSPTSPGDPDDKSSTSTEALQLQTGHDRSPTWYPARRCCHHRPDENDAKGIGIALKSTALLVLVLRVAPNPLHLGSRQQHHPASRTKLLPIPALDI